MKAGLVIAPPDRAGELACFIASLRTRVRTTRIAWALFLGAAVTLLLLAAGVAFGPGLGLQSRTLVFVAALLTGGLVALVSGVSARHTWTSSAVALDTERVWPALRNHLVTALELEAHPDRAAAVIRERVVAHATRVLQNEPPAAVHSWRQALLCIPGVLVCVTLIVLILAERPRLAIGSPAGSAPSRARTTTISEVDVIVTPPAYAARPAQRMRNPERLEVIAGSLLAVRIASGAPRVDVELSTSPTTSVARESPDAVRAVLRPLTSGLLSIATQAADGGIVDRRLVPVLVRPDAPPEVTIERPRSDRTVERATTRVAFSARATDDLGLASLTLHYTKVTGSGEQYAFKEGELPLALVRETPTRWRGDATRELSTLDLREGDLLVYFARAADRRPGAEPSVSDSYVIEIGRPNAAIAGGFAVPLEKDRAALSLSALIAKTERVHAARARLSSAELSEQTGGLAVEQRMVRAETLFLMGAHGEVEDEEAEAEHSNEIQEGRLENRGQADLREATRLMSTAERSLLVADTGAALPVQRAALAAMQRALSKQRYFLRTLPVRSQIDLTRRLSGDVSSARSWQRHGEKRRPDERIVEVRRLLADLAAYTRARLAPGTAPSPVPDDLVRRIMALDPESTVLQDAARDLTRLSDVGADWSARPHRDLLARIVSALQQQASHLPASSTAPPAFDAGSLRGAFADALRREGAHP
jgi:hypothetical protein